jgi:hypothetical protein
VAVKTPATDVLREAVRDQHSNETFEKSLARAVKKHQGAYQDYIDLIAKVRERAKKAKTALDDAARTLAAEE